MARMGMEAVSGVVLAGVLALAVASGAQARSDQDKLIPVLNAGAKTLNFDWPMIRIGAGEYAEGPTGVTVFTFGRKVLGAVDVRGGGPGTVNADYLRLGYNYPELDAVVFAGGSWYGLEAATAVETALKDDGVRDGDAFTDEPNIALTVGSIIYDFGPRRLNEIYPDKRLAQAAYRAARPGIFPQGAEGAGRFAKTGSLFGCNAYSGQGGAYKQIGDIKIAAFTVVNALGVVTDRQGRVVSCYPGASWPKVGALKSSDLMQAFPDSYKETWTGPEGQASRKNTTISLIVVNQKMDPAELQRLAAQVHTSMARALQPFATMADGDVLYAVSTAEYDGPAKMNSPSLGVAASEVMWDAILNSQPVQPQAPKVDAKAMPKADVLASFAGDYVFSQRVTVKVSAEGGKLMAQATGAQDAYVIGRKAAVELQPVSASVFTIPGRYPLTIDFSTPGKLVFNPGHWQQTGVRR